MSRSTVSVNRAELERLVAGEHHDPHSLLGAHRVQPRGGKAQAQWVVRVWRPDAVAAEVVLADGRAVPLDQAHPAGLFQGVVADGEVVELGPYEVSSRYANGDTWRADDAYRFWPTLGEVDLHLIGEGRHQRLWEVLGAHPRTHQASQGTAFAVWAPSARSVRVVGDFNSWDGRANPMRALGSSGVWELFLPGVGEGDRYKYEVVGADGSLMLRADPMAFAAEVPPSTASIVHAPHHRWNDDTWIERRAATDPLHSPMSVYELHLGSWRRVPEEGDRPLTYAELAEELPDYVADLGFTHVELMPVAEHPFSGSWGYQVTGYYAPTSRHGSPDDFRVLVDALHARGIGVIVDWVPAHFPRDTFALARFDGTALYEHADPRQGEHPDWGTLVFNFGRNEVRNFLIANAEFWVSEFHIDGLRVDAVASMLYLDYSRTEGQWLPNRFGGRENLEAVDFLREVNVALHERFPGVITSAEESTAWPAVSRPTYTGGLGFGFKWNMGWMHDTLLYFSKDPVHRRHHHHNLTFGLLYAFTENFVLPLSHDEVVHGKGSLLDKMPGTGEHRFANLRALLGWMWAHPGRPLLFMGGEIAQGREWSESRSLDWDLLGIPLHAGVQALVRDMNAAMAGEPALWERDFESSGFDWIDANDADQNVLSFCRWSADGSRALVCVANLAASDRWDYRVGLPRAGTWTEVLDTSSDRYAGWRQGYGRGQMVAEAVAWHGMDQSVSLQLMPLSVVWLAWQAEPAG